MVLFHRRVPRTLAPAWTTFAVLAATALAGPTPDRPGAITPYDLATRDDLLFAHLLAPLMEGEPADWPIFGPLGEQLGSWIDQFVSARQVASIITDAFPVEGQPALRPLDQVVDQC